MITYHPSDSEREKAANSYLMSLMAAMVGLPFHKLPFTLHKRRLPIVNMLATIIFYLANRKRTYYVRWHCTQALISQIPLYFTNTVLFWWTVRLLLGYESLTSFYFAYLFTVVLFNVIDYIATIYSAVKVRKGEQVEWYVYGGLTDLICKPA